MDSEQDEQANVQHEAWKVKRILAPVDFSEASLAGLDYAAAIGEHFDAELVVLFVVEPVRFPGDRDALAEHEQRVGRRELSRLEQRFRDRPLRYRALLQTGAPPQVIVEQAERLGADLIVMATHGRTGLSHLLLGSVAEKVVRSARCPVLTVHPVSPTT